MYIPAVSQETVGVRLFYYLFPILLVSLSSSYSAQHSTIASVVQLQICLINNKTQCQHNSRLLLCHRLEDPATVCARGSCCSWCQASGHWRASVALMAFGRGQSVSIYGHESMPLTDVSPVAALLWDKAAVRLCLLSWPKAAWVTPTFWAA